MRTSRLAALRRGCNPGHVKELRSSPTDAENRMWYYLRAGRFHKRKFRRQVPMGPYIVDFLCERARLIVEVDGGQHQEDRRYDAQRTAWLGARGYEVVRFWNNDVMSNIDGVMDVLYDALTRRDR